MDLESYNNICDYKERAVYPREIVGEQDKNVLKRKKRAFRKKCESFTLKDGVLYHNQTKAKPDNLREVPKESDIDRIIRAFHGNKAGGCHFGVQQHSTKLRNDIGGRECMKLCWEK